MRRRIGVPLRTLAAAIDGILLIGFGLILANIFSESIVELFNDLFLVLESQKDDALITSFSTSFWYKAIAVQLLFLAYLFTEVLFAGTPGKLLLGIAIANSNEEVASIQNLLQRFVVKECYTICCFITLLTGFGIFDLIGSLLGFIVSLGCILIFFPRKQALHDRIADTAVYEINFIKKPALRYDILHLKNPEFNVLPIVIPYRPVIIIGLIVIFAFSGVGVLNTLSTLSEHPGFKNLSPLFSESALASSGFGKQRSMHLAKVQEQLHGDTVPLITSLDKASRLKVLMYKLENNINSYKKSMQDVKNKFEDISKKTAKRKVPDEYTVKSTITLLNSFTSTIQKSGGSIELSLSQIRSQIEDCRNKIDNISVFNKCLLEIENNSRNLETSILRFEKKMKKYKLQLELLENRN